MSTIRILIVDDHPTMIEGYKSILYANGYDTDRAIITQVYNSESAFNLIQSAVPYDIILLDMSLPPYEPEKIFSGEDLAVLVQKRWPDTKIMMLTSHNETFILFELIKKINPEGLLVKSDFTPTEFLLAFNKILEGNTYYSYTASQSIKEVYLKDNYLDAYNRRIISLLAKGIATKSLPEHLNLSISAIDKRKAQIKDFLDIKKGGDEDIIREARKRGFV